MNHCKTGFFIVTTICLLPTFVSAENFPLHSHDGREHRHPLPAQGLDHQHTGQRQPIVTESLPGQAGVPKPQMVNIRGGYFRMGSPTNEADRSDTENLHPVLVKDFSIGKNEVTVGEFRRFVESTGYQTDAEKDPEDNCHRYKMITKPEYMDWKAPGFAQSDQHPVVCVSLQDAMAYASWLSKETGEQYGVPTEAQWEYAARAGTTTARYWGDEPCQACGYANVADQTAKNNVTGWSDDWEFHSCNDGHDYTAPVGSYQPNPWGLNDMLGNVREWTCSLSSAWGNTYTGKGWEQKCGDSTDTRTLMVRGGSWKDYPRFVRSASRLSEPKFAQDHHIGFRLSKTP